MDSVIVDLDGTLADCNHRLHFIESNKKDWQSFFNNCGEDLVIEPVRELINMLKEKYMIIILTARPDSIREPTTKWLEDNNINVDPNNLLKNLGGWWPPINSYGNAVPIGPVPNEPVIM